MVHIAFNDEYMGEPNWERLKEENKKMSESNTNYKNNSVGLFETTFKSGKLKGKKGYRGTINAEQYNDLVSKIQPGSTVFLLVNEFKTESKHPQFKLTFSEPKKEESKEF